jgi:hypothetical protein
VSYSVDGDLLLFAHPLCPAEAPSNVESMLNLPRVRVLSEREGYPLG